MNLIVRDMTALDRRFVVPTWALSSRYAGLSKPRRFRLVDRILDAGARVVVLATSNVTVHAWAAGDDEVLHYAYVPPALRGHGLARRAVTSLLGRYPDVIDVTHEWPGERARFRFTPHQILHEAA